MIDETTGNGSAHDIVQGTYNRKKVDLVARHVIVQLAPVEGAESLDVATADVLSDVEGARLVRPPAPSGRMVVLLPEGEDMKACIKTFAGASGVAYAEPDFIDRAQVVPNDPRYPQQWAPPLVNAEDAWDLETGASNVVIGIVDSGISMTAGLLDHDDLDDSTRITLGTDFVDGGTPRDLHGHGTHVAGIAAAASNNAAGVSGMNWDSPIYITRVFDANRNGSAADFADAVEEITDWALARGLKAVINYSGGGPDSLTKRNACQYASDNGMLLVAATGNDNGGPVIFPAAYSTAITGVVAVGSTDVGDTVSNFSNVGPEVTVVAPGRNILSTLPTYGVTGTTSLNYGTMSGTSMATPLVSGLAALMWSRHPGHTNTKIKDCLESSAVKLGSGNFDNSWGFGRVDALAALRCGDPFVAVTVIGPGCGVAVTAVGPGCGFVVTRVASCWTTRLVVTCSPPTSLCPVSRVNCPSRLPFLCPRPTRVEAICNVRSLVDDCPSTPGGCNIRTIIERRINPVLPITRRLRRLEAFLGLESEAWYEGDGTEASNTSEGDWFYVDDDGTIHEV
ncbi:MAG: S8 family serine peptidase [Actinomycetia bacterium]|nr:S8 family serine peptidase [Actinomycetes bacterium]